MADSLWENSFKDFLMSDFGKEMIVKSYDRHDETEQQSSIDRTIYSIFFNGLTIGDSCALMLLPLKSKPSETISRCHKILTEIGKQTLEEKGIKFPLNLSFRFRIDTLRPFDNAVLPTVPKEGDVGKLVEFCGTVVKVAQPRMIEKLKRFRCATCKSDFAVIADVTQNNSCPIPTRCANRESCEGVNIRQLPSNPLHDSKDYQEIKVQEKVGKSVIGKIPRSVWVILDEDLMDSCKAGDDVIVIGEVTRRWSPLGSGPNGRTDIEYILVANSVQVNNFQKSFRLLSSELTQEIEEFWQNHRNAELEGRNKILESFCPQVYGLYAVKLAVSVILCGGMERIDQTGTRIRGEPHMLLIGDPGTGKSQILRYAAKITSRSVMTTGIGSTSAGLTASASRDGGQWHLEAGALVMADGGLCCIDEFNSIKEVDRVAIHEAMEQQSISVAKAGLVCQLRTRCSILASTNPKGKYDPEEPLSVNVGIASPLLSRFDLVYLLLDSKNPSWDKRVSSYILQGKDPIKEMLRSSSANSEPIWSFGKMQSYFSYCKQFTPKIGSVPSRILSRYYQRRRMCAADNQNNNMARSTVRLLQSAIRLAEAHARFMAHEEVTVLDAVTVILLLDTSMDSNGSLVAAANPLHTSFPENPTKEYLRDAEAILTGLQLHDIWQEERKRTIENRGKPPAPRPPKLPTPHQSNLTRIKSPTHAPNTGLCPESVLSQSSRTVSEFTKRVNSKRQFLFSNDKELEDLDDIFDDFDNVTPSSKRPKIESKKSTDEMLTPDTVIINQSNDNISSEDSERVEKVENPSAETIIVQKTVAADTIGDFSVPDAVNDPVEKVKTPSTGARIVDKSAADDTFGDFSFSFPETSTQIDSPSKQTPSKTNKCLSKNDKVSKELSKMSNNTSPVLSTKTLSKLRAFAAPPLKDDVAEQSSNVDEGNGTSIVDKSNEKGSTTLSIIDKNLKDSIKKKRSFDNGNGSSIVDDDSSLVDGANKYFPPKSDKNENRSIFAEMSTNLDAEKQRSMLASVFSYHNSENFDDLDF